MVESCLKFILPRPAVVDWPNLLLGKSISGCLPGAALFREVCAAASSGVSIIFEL